MIRGFIKILTILTVAITVWFSCIHLNVISRNVNFHSYITDLKLSFSLGSRDIFPDFTKALNTHAKIVSSPNGREEMKFIILAMTDNSFTDMAMNLYLSSFKRFNISNFLFVGGGKNACEKLNQHKIQCVDFWEDPDSNKSNNYGSKEFIRKMNIRTSMILYALRLDYSVLHTDLDVVFLRNPMPEIENLLKDNEMAILWDHSVYNAGFLAIKATPFSVKVYTLSQKMTDASSKLDDQKALNAAIKQTKNDDTNIFILDTKRYLCGIDYYEKNRDFPSPDFKDNCPKCMVVHNNWIVSKEAKIHRFKETSMWFLDEDRYYSDENRKYILYYNPVISNLTSGFKVRTTEEMALKTGFKMASILNRTLIIPRFHCYDQKPKECPLNSWFKVKLFHDQFSNDYRESSFLLNDLVPQSISMKPAMDCSADLEDNHKTPTSLSTCNKQDHNPKSKCIPFNPIPILISTKHNTYLLNEILKTFPASEVMDLSEYDSLNESVIVEKFGQCSDQVLVLSSLLEVQINFSNKDDEKLLNDKFKKGIKSSKYVQL